MTIITTINWHTSIIPNNNFKLTLIYLIRNCLSWFFNNVLHLSIPVHYCIRCKQSFTWPYRRNCRCNIKIVIVKSYHFFFNFIQGEVIKYQCRKISYYILLKFTFFLCTHLHIIHDVCLLELFYSTYSRDSRCLWLPLWIDIEYFWKFSDMNFYFQYN